MFCSRPIEGEHTSLSEPSVWLMEGSLIETTAFPCSPSFSWRDYYGQQTVRTKDGSESR